MASDSRDPSQDRPSSRDYPPIRVWRYDDGYGAPASRGSGNRGQSSHGQSSRGTGGRSSGRRRRKRPIAWLWRGPQGELLDLVTLLPRRFPIPSLLLLSLGLWLSWPMLMANRGAGAALAPDAPEVITTFVEDPMRSVAAYSLWRTRPGALLVLQGSAGSQAINLEAMQARGIRDDGSGKVVTLTQGCDTLGQLTALARFLSRQPKPGRLTVVTSPAHLDRSVAIARIVLGSQGWEVEGMAAATGDNRPESSWRLWRDQARSQLWRFTGWDGTTDGTACQARTQGQG